MGLVDYRQGSIGAWVSGSSGNGRIKHRPRARHSQNPWGGVTPCGGLGIPEVQVKSWEVCSMYEIGERLVSVSVAVNEIEIFVLLF